MPGTYVPSFEYHGIRGRNADLLQNSLMLPDIIRNLMAMSQRQAPQPEAAFCDNSAGNGRQEEVARAKDQQQF